MFECRQCSAWRRHSQDVTDWPSCHPDCLRQKIIQKVQLRILTEGPLNFTGFPLLILKVLGLKFLKDCKLLQERGLGVFAQMTKVPPQLLSSSGAKAPLFEAQTSQAWCLGKYLSGRISEQGIFM